MKQLLTSFVMALTLVLGGAFGVHAHDHMPKVAATPPETDAKSEAKEAAETGEEMAQEADAASMPEHEAMSHNHHDMAAEDPVVDGRRNMHIQRVFVPLPYDRRELMVAPSYTRIAAHGVGAAYMSIRNNIGHNARLVAAQSDYARIELHTVEEDASGVLSMMEVPHYDIKDAETAEFKPGGNHLMLFDVTLPKDADKLPIKLRFEDDFALSEGVEILVHFPILGLADKAPKQ